MDETIPHHVFKGGGVEKGRVELKRFVIAPEQPGRAGHDRSALPTGRFAALADMAFACCVLISLIRHQSIGRRTAKNPAQSSDA